MTTINDNKLKSCCSNIFQYPESRNIGEATDTINFCRIQVPILLINLEQLSKSNGFFHSLSINWHLNERKLIKVQHFLKVGLQKGISNTKLKETENCKYDAI